MPKRKTTSPIAPRPDPDEQTLLDHARKMGMRRAIVALAIVRLAQLETSDQGGPEADAEYAAVLAIRDEYEGPDTAGAPVETE